MINLEKTKSEWKKTLSLEEYRVLREGGTEEAFTGTLLDNKKEGVYRCKACLASLFSSEDKFDSGSGWPSFHSLIEDKSVILKEDKSLFGDRVEVICSRCKSHLGHVFNDALNTPTPTGKRYCINSICLDFKEETK